MTLVQAKQIAKDLGFTLTTTVHDEYRINRKGGTEASAYYTNDLDDALSTARNWEVR